MCGELSVGTLKRREHGKVLQIECNKRKVMHIRRCGDESVDDIDAVSSTILQDVLARMFSCIREDRNNGNALSEGVEVLAFCFACKPCVEFRQRNDREAWLSAQLFEVSAGWWMMP